LFAPAVNYGDVAPVTVIQYSLNGVSVTAELSSESGRIDLNRADPEVIDRALRGGGIGAQRRQVFKDRLLQYRQRKQSLIALAEIDALAQQAGIAADAGFDLRENFTITSGLPQPDPAHLPTTLASALGLAAPTGPARVSPGSSLRLILRAEKAAPLMLVFRTTGLLDQPVLISDWERVYYSR
jgi:hypothetical protein